MIDELQHISNTTDMYRIRTYNQIATKGLALLDDQQYIVSDNEKKPDGIIVRSATLKKTSIAKSVIAIARAGVGVNNIDVEYCTENGIPVFNTPGANANSVKEIVLAALLLSSRRIFQGMLWTQSLAGQEDEIPALVEKQKKAFNGPEIRGKTLGVIGLGAVGVTIANAAIGLGLKVIGYDPYLSIQSAWRLHHSAIHVQKMETLLATSDYITIHVPYSSATHHLIDKQAIAKMQAHAHLLNFSRSGLVVNKDVLAALKKKKLGGYITDFPEDDLLGREGVLCTPHLGASTPEAEEQCAIMAIQQLQQYLKNGNIENSVNFPACALEINNGSRLSIIHKNVPTMVSQITGLLGREKMNISDMMNKHRGSIAYTIIDVEGDAPQQLIDNIRNIADVIRIRHHNKKQMS